jgi:NADH dehydrogenase
MAGQISELAHRTLRADFRRIDPTRSRVILLDAADRVLPTFHEKLSENARRRLERMGVEVQLGTKVVDVDAAGVEVVTPDGEHRRIEAATKIWAAGVAANPLGPLIAQKTGAETDRAGRVKVAPDCTVPGHPEIFVVGDLMALDKLPGVAQVAMQSGKHAAKEIKRRLAGDTTPKPFHYFDKGNMATISRFSAIADIPGAKVRLTGFVAWLAWLFIHIIYLIGFKNRVTTLLHWFISFIGRGRSERTSTEQQVFGRRAMERVGGQLSSSIRPGAAAGPDVAAGPAKDLASPAPDPGRAPAVTVPTGAAVRDQ